MTEKLIFITLTDRRAKLVENTLNSIEGIHCNEVQGAMYAFPRVSYSLFCQSPCRPEYSIHDRECIPPTGTCLFFKVNLGVVKGIIAVLFCIIIPYESAISSDVEYEPI
jgi:hypothetical protein